jgi:hypothetical protein
MRLLGQAQHLGPGAGPAASHADVEFDQDADLGAGPDGRGRQRFDVPRVVHGHGEVDMRGERRGRADLIRRYDLVGDEHVGHPGRGHRGGLPNRRHGNPDRACRDLQERDVRRLLHLRVRAQPRGLAGQRRGHHGQVPVQCLDVNHQRRRGQSIGRLANMAPVLICHSLLGAQPGLPPVTHRAASTLTPVFHFPER